MCGGGVCGLADRVRIVFVGAALGDWVGGGSVTPKKESHLYYHRNTVEKIGGLYYVVCHCRVLRCQTAKGFKTENEAVMFWNSDK